MKAQLLIAVVLGLLLARAASAQDSDKLDIQKLEDKYWAAKDDDFSVVQNRAFTKAKRVFVTALYGVPINDPNSTGNISGLSTGYYLSERLGFEATYLKAAYRDNDATDQFKNEHGTMPNHNKLADQITLSVNYVPLYAKMSFLDRKIIYFDMGVGLGFGQTTYDAQIVTGNRSQKGTHYGLDIFQHFFFSERIAFKLLYRNTWTQEERFRYKMNTGEPESNRSLGNKSINDTTFMFGVTGWF